MPLPEPDGSTGYSFGLEIDGVVIKNITQMSGLKIEQDVIESKENTADGGYVVKKLPGRWKAGECTLTRALGGDDSFQLLIKNSQLRGRTTPARAARSSSSIFEGKEVKRYHLHNAWPKSLEIETLK